MATYLKPQPGATPPLIAPILAEFAANLRFDAIPPHIRERAKHLMLDAAGIALASTRFDFARRSLSALTALAGLDSAAGDSVVIGFPQRLPLRDAVQMNGILVHGLDFDDTHVPGVIHATASAFSCALGVTAKLKNSGQQLITAYVLGIEIAARLGAVAKGGFHQVGFHPTSLIGAFSCALQSGRLFDLTPQQLSMAQGIALSVAAGSMEFLADGAWTKRMHPGWAGVGGITAASLAQQGFIGPAAAYEGRFGLYASHLGALLKDCDFTLATAGLGERWELEQVAVKPFPACHFTHACADAALNLRERGIRVEDIVKVRALIPQEVITTVCEPVASKKRPANSYDAQFSIPYAVAVSFLRGKFGLAELEDEAREDAAILALAAKVDYEIDPNSGFPKYYSGEVIITTRDGTEHRHREHINRGAAERPISAQDIVRKFMGNAELAVSRARAEVIRDVMLTMDTRDAHSVAETLAAQEKP